MPHETPAGAEGILPDRMIAELAGTGGIRPSVPFAGDQIQPASLDLRLGKVAYRVRASFLPGPQAEWVRSLTVIDNQTKGKP